MTTATIMIIWADSVAAAHPDGFNTVDYVLLLPTFRAIMSGKAGFHPHFEAFSAAWMKAVKMGCGCSGVLLNSGWN